MTIELKPCPMCGSSANVEYSGSAYSGMCDNVECLTEGPVRPTEEEAAKAWNTRANGWMPIETAPRDETDVDLWVKTDKISFRLPDAWWGPEDECWYYRDESGWAVNLSSGTTTHWMPIPKAPEVQP